MRKSTSSWALMLVIAASAVSGCGQHPSGAGCHIFGSKIRPDPEWQTRWTQSEKRQALKHNEKVQRFCAPTKG